MMEVVPSNPATTPRPLRAPPLSAIFDNPAETLIKLGGAEESFATLAALACSFL